MFVTLTCEKVLSWAFVRVHVCLLHFKHGCSERVSERVCATECMLEMVCIVVK